MTRNICVPNFILSLNFNDSVDSKEFKNYALENYSENIVFFDYSEFQEKGESLKSSEALILDNINLDLSKRREKIKDFEQKIKLFDENSLFYGIIDVIYIITNYPSQNYKINGNGLHFDSFINFISEKEQKTSRKVYTDQKGMQIININARKTQKENFEELEKNILSTKVFNNLIYIFETFSGDFLINKIRPYLEYYITLDEIKDATESTLLHYFVTKPNFKKLNQLIGFFKTVNHKNQDGNTPMHLCYDNFSFFAELYEVGGNYMEENNEKETPFLLMIKNGCFESFRKLIDLNRTFLEVNIEDIVDSCIRYTSWKSLQCIANDFSKQIKIIFDQRHPRRLLFRLYDDIKIVAVKYIYRDLSDESKVCLLNNCPEFLWNTLLDFYDESDVQRLSFNENISSYINKFSFNIKDLASKNISYIKNNINTKNVNSLDIHWCNILYYAVCSNNSECLKYILGLQGIEITKECKGETILYTAAKHSSLTLTLLLSNGLSNEINKVSDNKYTPIFAPLVEKTDKVTDKKEIINTCIAFGARVDVLNPSGKPLLYHAIHNGINDNELITKLIYPGIDMKDAFLAAAEQGFTNICSILMDRGMIIDKDILIKMFSTAKNLDTFYFITKYTEKDPSLVTMDLFEAAIENSNYVALEFLEKLEVSQECRDSNGNTWLHLVANKCKCRSLISIKSILECKNKDDENFLHSAARGQNIEFIEQLKREVNESEELSEIIDKLICSKNKDGATPLDIAASIHNNIFDEFKKHPIFEGEPTVDKLREFFRVTGTTDLMYEGKTVVTHYCEKIEDDEKLLECLKLFKDYDCMFTYPFLKEDYSLVEGPNPIDYCLNKEKSFNFLIENGAASKVRSSKATNYPDLLLCIFDVLNFIENELNNSNDIQKETNKFSKENINIEFRKLKCVMQCSINVKKCYTSCVTTRTKLENLFSADFYFNECFSNACKWSYLQNYGKLYDVLERRTGFISKSHIVEIAKKVKKYKVKNIEGIKMAVDVYKKQLKEHVRDSYIENRMKLLEYDILRGKCINIPIRGKNFSLICEIVSNNTKKLVVMEEKDDGKNIIYVADVIEKMEEKKKAVFYAVIDGSPSDGEETLEIVEGKYHLNGIIIKSNSLIDGQPSENKGFKFYLEGSFTNECPSAEIYNTMLKGSIAFKDLF